MPFMPGILMSVTITSYRADSIFFTASSPELTISTLCPSLRRAMSRSSRMERSSSHTKTLAMHSLRRSYCSKYSVFGNAHCSRSCLCLRKFHDDLRTVFGSRQGVYAPSMSLHNLINQRESQSGTAFEAGLKRFKYFFRLLGTDTYSAVFKGENPIAASCTQSHLQRAAFRHGAKSVVAQVPED